MRSRGATRRRPARLQRLVGVLVALGAQAASGQPAPPRSAGFDIDPYADVATLQAAMREGRLTARELARFYLERIERLDRSGPTLRAVLETNPDALAIADALDRERASGRVRGPLHGIPVLIKDNIDTADRMHTTAGSLALLASKPLRDAHLVERLRESGAVILGKTNLSEWANFRSSRSTSGWSARGGQTRNPHALDRNPCGSSSGSAVAAAAGLAVLAVGTETDGSIVCPSAMNGIVGLKPTVGLVSRSGVVPISASQDTAGPMTRSVADAAALLAALAGPDPRDGATRAGAASPRDYLGALRADGLAGARIGVARDLAGFHEGVDAVLAEAIARLRRAGAIVVDPVKLDLPESVARAELVVLLYEFKDGIERYLSARPGAPRNLAELIAFNERERERELAWFGQEIFHSAQAKGALTEREYLRARKASEAAAERIDAVLERHDLDAIVAPTAGPAWVTDLVNGDHYSGGGASTAPAVAGYPHITVPAGFVHGLPIGLSFIGTAWSEATLLRLAHAFELASGARRAPELTSQDALPVGDATGRTER